MWGCHAAVTCDNCDNCDMSPGFCLDLSRARRSWQHYKCPDDWQSLSISWDQSPVRISQPRTTKPDLYNILWWYWHLVTSKKAELISTALQFFVSSLSQFRWDGCCIFCEANVRLISYSWITLRGQKVLLIVVLLGTKLYLVTVTTHGNNNGKVINVSINEWGQ